MTEDIQEADYEARQIEEQEANYEARQIEAEVINAHDVETALLEISEMRDELVGIKDHAAKQIARAQEWADAEEIRIRKDLNWKESSVLAWFRREHPDKASKKLIHGTLKRKVGSLVAEILEADEVPRAFCEHIPASWRPDKNKIKAHYKETGEILPGMDIERTDTTYTVDTGHKELKQ